MSKELYNSSYQKFTPEFLSDQKRLESYFHQNSLSLRKFFNQHKEQYQYFTGDKTCLELGCGIGSFSQFLAAEFYQVDAIDISDLAISMARDIHNKVNFYASDIFKYSPEHQYDFIFDSHLFHCLTNPEERQKYLSKIKQWLKPDGIFLMESMVFHERLQIPVDYSFDENYVLSQNIKGDFVKTRSILPSLQIEEYVKASGLELNYFYYHNELSFHVFDLYPEYPLEFLPKTVRLSANLPLE